MAADVLLCDGWGGGGQCCECMRYEGQMPLGSGLPWHSGWCGAVVAPELVPLHTKM